MYGTQYHLPNFLSTLHNEQNFVLMSTYTSIYSTSLGAKVQSQYFTGFLCRCLQTPFASAGHEMLMFRSFVVLL